jgi:hypothetical protein
MHAHHSIFLDALAAKRRLSVRFLRKKEGRELTRVCAPLDYGPLRGAKDATSRYQLWDLEGKRKPLNIVLADDEVLEMTVLDETFDPADIITWAFKPNSWTVARDWANFS